MENKRIKRETGLGEKLAYSLGDSGAGFVWTFTGSFLTLYYTDSVLLSAAFVGTMMLVTRICDGISDIAMGFVIERTHTKIGKARPWFGLSILPLIISFLLMFRVPQGLSDQKKCIYVAVTYFVMTVLIYTVNNLSFHSMLSRISLTQDDRNKISSIRGIFAFITGLVLSIGTTTLLKTFGGESSQYAWSTISLIYGGICLVFQTICFLFTREKITADGETENGRISYGDTIKTGIMALLKTKYFYLSVIVFICSYIISGSTLGVSVYYARDVLGNSGYYAFIAICYVLPMVIGMVLVPHLVKKFSKRKVMVCSGLLAAVGYLIGILFPYELKMVLASTVIGSLGSSPFSSIMFTLAPDIVDHLETKIGIRIEGLATSATSFGMKVGTGLGSAMIGWGLAIGMYNPQAEQQPHTALIAEIMLLFAIPLIATVIRSISMIFWDIDRDAKLR